MPKKDNILFFHFNSKKLVLFFQAHLVKEDIKAAHWLSNGSENNALAFSGTALCKAQCYWFLRTKSKIKMNKARNCLEKPVQ